MAPLGSVTFTFGDTISLITRQTTRINVNECLRRPPIQDLSQKLRIKATQSSDGPLRSNPKLVRSVVKTNPDNDQGKEHKLLKDDVRRELLKTTGEPLEFLKLVDTLERLGVAYHLEMMIEETLKHIYNTEEDNNLDLYHTSLKFRILRQHGYYVASNVFEKFMDEQGNFLETLKDDAESILYLYEAAHVRGHGEDTLEKALEFSKIHLKSIVDAQLEHPLELRISRALKYPIQKSMTRLESGYSISFYEQDPCHNKSMLRFAKLDFNLLQSVYKEEIKELNRWMEIIDFEKKFPFARARPMECHLFSVQLYSQRKFSTMRKIFTKTFILATILDDLYDGIDTIEELESFTQVINRWDKDGSDQLSGYMREAYKILYDTFEEFENDMDKLGRKNYIHYLRNETITYSKALMQESKWRRANYVPMNEEFPESTIGTSAINVVMVLSLLENEVEESAIKMTFENVSTYDKLQRAPHIIGRIMNDIADYEFDRQRERLAGAVDCYMKQYDVSKEDACVMLSVFVEDAWKDLTEEMFRPSTPIPVSLVKRIHGFSRVCNYIYKYDNAYTMATKRMKSTLSLLFVEPVC